MLQLAQPPAVSEHEVPAGFPERIADHPPFLELL